MSTISDVFAKAPPARPGVQKTPELGRILALPRRRLDLEAGAVDGVPMLDLNQLFVKNAGPCEAHPRCPVCLSGKVSLWPTQIAALLEAERAWGLFGPMGVGSGKCVVGSTEIYDVFSGRRRTACEEGPLCTPAFNAVGKQAIYPASAFASGSKYCMQLRLKGGQQVELSTDHPVRVSSGWKKAVDLLPHDLVAVPRKMPEPIKTIDCSDEEVSLVAYLLSDGDTTSGSVRFTNMDSRVLADFTQVVNALTVSNGRHKKTGVVDTRSRTCGRATTLRARGVYHLVSKWGLRELSKNKRVPSDLYGLPDRQIALFLNRFWACDGHVAKNVLEVVLASEKLIDDLRFMLLRLGVMTRKRFKPSKYRGKAFNAWRLTVSGNQVVRFLQTVGDVLGKEPACQRLRENTEALIRNTNVDVVPIGRSEVSEICDELEISGRQVRRRQIRDFLGATIGQRVSRDKFSAFCDRFDYRGKYYWLAESDFAWERVDSITFTGIKEVFDLNVPSAGNFVADGIVVHNTAVTLLLPEVFEAERAVILVPPSLKNQLLTRDIHDYGRHFSFDAKRITVVSYAEISVASGAFVLDKIEPDLIIADEVHSLARIQSARTKRFVRYLQTHPGTRFCGLSGTVTRRSLRDFSHLCEIALRAGSPLPYRWSDLQEWADALDPIKDPIPIGALKAFVDPADPRLVGTPDEARQAAREGFRRRLIETPGVVATSESWEGSSLVITALKPQVPKSVDTAISTLLKSWSIGGEEIEDKTRLKEIARQLSVGFYYKWMWPNDTPDVEWLTARAQWHKAVRFLLQRSRAGLDSPLLIARAIMSGQIDDEFACEAWAAWSDVRDRYNPTPPVEPVWIDDFAIREANKWAVAQLGTHSEPSIVWYSHQAVGDALSDLGFPMYGPGADAGEADPERQRVIVCSIRAQGTGKNLQRYSRSLVVEPPRSGMTWEQLLGRQHRPAQQADEVNYDVFVHTPELLEALQRAIEDALYVQQTQGQRQKLLVAKRVGW